MTGMLMKNIYLHEQRFFPATLNTGPAMDFTPAGLFPGIPACQVLSHRRYPANDGEDLFSRNRRPSYPAAQESAGRLLVMGPADDAQRAVERLKNHFSCVLLLDPEDSPDPEGTITRTRGGSGAVTVKVTARLRSLRGHLGRFSATISSSRLAADLMYYATGRCEYVDLVLDLGETAILPADSRPYGYFAAGSTADDHTATLQTLASLSGLIRDLKQAIS